MIPIDSPGSSSLREIAETFVSLSPDAPFDELFPTIAQHAGTDIGDRGPVSSRLLNVLRRWRGTDWGSYARETPVAFLRRRNCGLRSLGEFLWITSRLPERPTATATKPTEPGAVDADGGDPTAMDASVLEAIRLVSAWGAYERGRADIRAALELATSGEVVPELVRSAAERIDRISIRAWARVSAGDYDVRGQIETIAARLDDREHEIASHRLLALARPATLDELAAQLGLTRARIGQLDARLRQRLRQWIGSDQHATGRTTRRLRAALGSAWRVAGLELVGPLRDLGLVDLDDFGTRVLLWGAGPYKLAGDWLVLAPARKMITESKSALSDLTNDGPVALTEVIERLGDLGVRPSEALEWIVTLGGFRVDDETLIPWGGSLADKAEVVLTLNGVPLAQDELLERLGDGRTVRSLLNQLQSDPRFKRTGLRTYGLAHWDHDEYTGIADEIAQEIDRQGGRAALDHLMQSVSTTYGVSASSVRAYALGPRFTKLADGMITHRQDGPAKVSQRPMALVRGAVHLEGSWSYRLRVTEAMVGGSGTPIPDPIAREFGLEPLGSLALACGETLIRFTWPTLNPQVGSLRPVIARLGAGVGDHLIISRDEAELRVRVLGQRELSLLSGYDRLARELGVTDAGADPPAAIAVAIGVVGEPIPSLIRRRLLARGEPELASLVPEDEPDEPILLSLDAARFVEVRWAK